MDNEHRDSIEETIATEEEKQDTWKPQDADKEFIKQQIRNRVRNATVSDNTTFLPAKPDPTILDDEPKSVAVYARVSTKSTEQVSSIENQTRYYSEKIEKTPNWTMQEIYSDEGKSGTSMRKRTEFVRMLQDAKDKKMDLILCASVSRFARNVSDCMEQVRTLKTQNPNHPVGVYFETENIYTLDPNSHQALSMHAMLADWESANKSRRMILSYDQRICMGQYPVLDLLGYRHTKDGQLVIDEEEAKTVRYIFLSYLNGASLKEIAASLSAMKRPTLRGRTDWNPAMVQNVMTNERRWGDLHARKTIVVDFVKGKTRKNDHIRDAAYVNGHHDGIVTPEIAKAVQVVRQSHYSGGLSEASVIKSGSLKGFVSLTPQWFGNSHESLMEICKWAYTDRELSSLMRESQIRAGAEHSNVLSMSFTGYQVPQGAMFISRSTPTVTVSRKYLKFSKATMERFSGCEYVEILYHPILKVLALRSSKPDAPNSYRLGKEKVQPISILAAPFSKVLYQELDWIKSYNFRFRGITRVKKGSSIVMFYLDEPQILVDKSTRNKYKDDENYPLCYIPYRNSELSENHISSQNDGFGLSIGMRKKRDKLINSLKKADIDAKCISIIDPVIGALPSKEEIQEELDNLLLSM